MDNRYYKKNAQLRYQLSKELDIYKEKKEDSEKNKINPFVIPIFSSVIAISTAIAGFLANNKELGLGIKAYLIVLQVCIAYMFFYLFAKYVVYTSYLWIKKEISHLKTINKEFDKRLSHNEKKKLLAKFDFDITGLIYLSYVIATDIAENNATLNEYNRGEALFYIDRSLKKLQSVFVDYPQYTPNIYEYRIKNNMDLLGASIISLSKSSAHTEDNLELYIHNAIIQFNIIGKAINNKYSKLIVSLINEN